MLRSFTLVSLIHVLVCLNVSAQPKTLYSYQELSHLFYKKQIDSLKKAWSCPSIYKDKATQKKYKEIWEERTSFLINAIENDSYVRDKEVYDYVNDVVTQITKANTSLIPVQPMLLIDRSASVNAYAVGNNIIAVNLGLIVFSQSREELSLVIAHEMAHNILSHADNAMKQRAEWLASDEYKETLNAVLDSKYERLSRLKKVLENFTFDRRKHQRYKESEADSLAIQLLKKSNIAFKADFFLRLDSADMVYKQPLKNPVKNYFAAYKLPVEDAWTQKRSKGLSTRAYNFSSDTSTLRDSLKTHPDCVVRYNNTKIHNSNAATLTAIPKEIHDKANKMLIWNMFSNMSLTPCLFRILMEKDNGNVDAWYDFMIHNIITGLYYADRELRRFNAIGVTQKEYISKDYYQLQTMLEQIPREELEKYCKILQSAGFWGSMSPSEKALKNFMYTLALDPDNTDKNKAKAAKDFTSGNAYSMYCELTQPFTTR